MNNPECKTDRELVEEQCQLSEERHALTTIAAMVFGTGLAGHTYLEVFKGGAINRTAMVVAAGSLIVGSFEAVQVWKDINRPESE